MLARRWGIFWRPLEVKFKRRAPLIGAALRLHNYCIDRRIGIKLREQGGFIQTQPRVWMQTPLCDDQGRLSEFLDTADHSNRVGDRSHHRNRLRDSLRVHGLKQDAAKRAVRLGAS